MFNIEDYDYDLPEELIAQTPLSKRHNSRLLSVERGNGSLADHNFFDLPDLLEPGDLLVVNNTRVIPARLFGRKESGGLIELLVLGHGDGGLSKADTRWCLCRSSKRPRQGSLLLFESDVTGRVEALGDDGLVKISFRGPISLKTFLDREGVMPLPPYIKRKREDERSSLDRERYQTLFSREEGAVAAPTAGLHFSEELIEGLKRAGISIVELTLHVGFGTFKPVRNQDIRNHDLGKETYIIEPSTAEALNQRAGTGRRIAVGTTVVRALEAAADVEGRIAPGRGETDLLIYPGYPFRVMDGLITNFHLPRSSLLFLVSAFAGASVIRKAYQWALRKRYRFYSYGDAMLIL